MIPFPRGWMGTETMASIANRTTCLSDAVDIFERLRDRISDSYLTFICLYDSPKLENICQSWLSSCFYIMAPSALSARLDSVFCSSSMLCLFIIWPETSAIMFYVIHLSLASQCCWPEEPSHTNYTDAGTANEIKLQTSPHPEKWPQ